MPPGAVDVDVETTLVTNSPEPGPPWFSLLLLAEWKSLDSPHAPSSGLLSHPRAPQDNNLD